MARKNKVRDWIIVHDGTQGSKAYALECTRCGTVQPVALPISVNCWCAMARAFEKDHATCTATLGRLVTRDDGTFRHVL